METSTWKPEFRRSSTCNVAILSFFVGLISMGALASMVLWIMPIVSIIFSLIALRSIQRADVPPIGKSLVIFSLALSFLVGFWAPTRHFTRMSRFASMGRQYSQKWFDLVLKDKNFERAHGLTKAYGERMLQSTGGAGMVGMSAKQKKQQNALASKDGKDEMYAADKYFSKHPLSTLVRYANDGKLEFVKTDNISYVKQFNAHVVSQLYRFTYEEKGQKRIVNVSIILQREKFDDIGRARWHIKDVKDADTDRSAIN